MEPGTVNRSRDRAGMEGCGGGTKWGFGTHGSIVRRGMEIMRKGQGTGKREQEGTSGLAEREPWCRTVGFGLNSSQESGDLGIISLGIVRNWPV
jgi:hypothetical protein